MADVMAKLRNMDMYPKTKDEFRVRTMQGGVSSLFAVVVAIILVRSELKHSLAVSTHDRLFVNSSHGDGLSVRFELEFPRANCELLAIDANDESGQPLEGVQQHVIKTRLDTNGRRVLVKPSSHDDRKELEKGRLNDSLRDYDVEPVWNQIRAAHAIDVTCFVT